MMRRLAPAACAMLALGAPAWSTDIIDEARVGVLAHDLTNSAEQGPQVAGEILFTSPPLLRRAGSPRPFVYGSFNTQGLTDIGSAGLAWRRELPLRLSVEGAVGLAYHDGVLDVSLDRMTEEEAVRTKQTRALLGSHVLFRTALGVDARVSERWSVGIYYEHFSHGQILGEGRNQGLDELGARIGYHFR
ncbi:MAG: acyloxyacyl hydrolase [Caulobacterales bacterium]|nr:acyloxyacyl hydrolase [Caulobacterales bacterium]